MKMLKEERALRDFIRYHVAYSATDGDGMKLVRAFRSAVIEECAKMCEATSSPASITNAGAFYAHIIRNGKMEYRKYLRNKQAAIRRKEEEEMPGPVSQSSRGPSNDSPYVPSWCYKNGPKMCPCGHDEGYHGDDGKCLLSHKCRCKGLPPSCLTPIEDC